MNTTEKTTEKKVKKEKKQLTERQVERRNAIISTVKSFIGPTVILAIIAGFIFVITNYQNATEVEEIIQPYAYGGEEEPVVMENDALKFTMDPTTTQFEVLVKETGKVWKSTPDGAQGDSLALPDEKESLQSNLVMTYSTEAGLETTYNSFGFSVKNGIYEIESGDDYVKVNYSLGNVEKEFTIPPVITKKEFKAWLKKMDTKDSNFVSEYYKKYDIKKLSKKDNEEELLASYPILKDTVIYVLRSTTKDNVKENIQTLFENAGYTYEDYLKDKELDMSTTVSEKPIFNVSMIFKLDGDDLLVEVPLNSLEYKKEYPIYTLTPLPYFGAGSTEDNGYMIVPEGGGALINFNNGRVAQNSYYANIYGWDMCLSRKAVVHTTRASFNTFGIANEDDSFICILEDGKSYAAVTSDISGKNNSYNYVNAKYSICQREQYDVGDIANSEIYKYIDKLPDESLVQRYRFVSSGDYVDMAKNYGDYLKAVYGSYMTLNDDTEAPVAVEIIGAVDKVKQIVGMPVSMPLKMTTYNEASDMIKELYNDGFKNMSVKLSGWCNGGVSQKLLKHVRTISDLGSKSDLQNVSKTANDLGVKLYLNGSTAYERQSKIYDGFITYRDAAKLISKERARLHPYSAVTYAEAEWAKDYFLLHTDLANKMADNLEAACNEYNAGISYEDIGQDLSSDFYKKKPYSREAVLKLEEERLKRVNDANNGIMVNMGNDYAVPYANMVTNMDLQGNAYTILDECIPFYQLAVHGYVNYTGFPLNDSGDDVLELLHSAEYGAGLSFTTMRETAFALQKTLYTEYYGADYGAWHDRMVSTYDRYNKELGHVFNQEMTGHKNLTETLSLTEYADGTKVYVNYDFADTDADGVTVPARDYLVIK